MKVKMIKPYQFAKHMSIPKGTVLLMRKLPTGIFEYAFQVIEEGMYSGIKVPYEYFVELSEGKMYSQAELDTEMKRKNAEIRRLEDEVDAERAEKQLLLQQIERTLEEHRDDRPTIPLNVSEAILACAQANIPNHRIFTLCNFAERLFRQYDRATLNALETIRLYKTTSADCEEKLFRALVLGYTVEQPKQDLLKASIQRIIEDWWSTSSKDHSTVVQEIADLVKSFYKDEVVSR